MDLSRSWDGLFPELESSSSMLPSRRQMEAPLMAPRAQINTSYDTIVIGALRIRLFPQLTLSSTGQDGP